MIKFSQPAVFVWTVGLTLCILSIGPATIFFAAGAGVLAAENSTMPKNSLLSDRACISHDSSILTWLLTWSDKEKQANSNEEDENAKETPLESDRPDFTDSSTTVGYKRLQIESGYTYTHDIAGNPTHDTHDLPEMLIRYGAAERLELRIAWDEGIVFDHYTDRNSGRHITENGRTDMELGIKYDVSKQDKWRPQSAIVVSVTAPVGSSDQSSGQVDVLINYLYSWELSRKLSLNFSTGSLWTAESGDHLSRFSQSASVEYELTEKLHTFNECFAFFRRDFSDNRPQYYYDSGWTFLVTPNFQLDWRAGLGLNDAADGFFTGCGLTIRK